LKEDYPAAERDYREALRISKNNDNEEGIATTNSSLANLALKREEWAEAEFLAREALVLAEKVGRQMLIAGVCRQIAEAMLKQNRNLEKALSFSHRAVEIYRRLRVSGELRLAQETFAEIEKKIIENQIQL
jgi:tetratricopeptide (TPR) repeat protein